MNPPTSNSFNNGATLNPQQVQQMRSQIGITPVSKGSTNTIDPQTRISALKSGTYGTPQTQTKTQPSQNNGQPSVSDQLDATEAQRAQSIKETFGNYNSGKTSLPQAALNTTGQVVGSAFDAAGILLGKLGINFNIQKGSAADNLANKISDKIMEEPNKAYDLAHESNTRAFELLKQANQTKDPVEKQKLITMGKQFQQASNQVLDTLSSLDTTLGENAKSAEAVSNIGTVALGAESAPELKSSLETGIDSTGSAAKNVMSKAQDVTSGVKEKVPGLKSITEEDKVNTAIRDTTPNYETSSATQKGKFISQGSVKGQEPTITIGGKTLTLDQVHGADGQALFKNLSSADRESFTNFDKHYSLVKEVEDMQAKGQDISDFKSEYDKRVNSQPEIAQGSSAKINPGSPEMPRVKEGGLFKGRSLNSTSLEKEAGQELSKVEGYDPSATKLAKYQLAKGEIATRGQALRESLKNEKISVPKKEIISTVRNAVNEVPEESLLLQKSDPVIKNYMRVTANAVGKIDGTLEGVLNLRQALDDAYENARGKLAYGSDKISSLDEIHKASRDSLTQYLIDHAQETDVKTSLRGQWNLYRAADQLQADAEYESGSSVGRLIQKTPGAKTGIKIIKSKVPFAKHLLP